MIELFSLEFWIAVLFIINFILVFFLFLFGSKTMASFTVLKATTP